MARVGKGLTHAASLWPHPSPPLCQLYHDSEQTDKATEALVRAYSLYPSDTDEEAINILCELYIHTKKYQEGCQVCYPY